tara:strand:+ start:35918 stop:36358 length:441 start_codon:yes stop_codon:yes gene_type:complete
MTRKTSIDCYNQIKREGLLSERRLQVLSIMMYISPCSAGELEKEFILRNNIKGGWKQLSVLRDQGVLKEVGTKTCSVTGRKVIKWDLTGNLPVKPKKKKPANLNKCIDYLIEGMDMRNWDTISKSMLIKLKTDVKKKETTTVGSKV